MGSFTFFKKRVGGPEKVPYLKIKTLRPSEKVSSFLKKDSWDPWEDFTFWKKIGALRRFYITLKKEKLCPKEGWIFLKKVTWAPWEGLIFFEKGQLRSPGRFHILKKKTVGASEKVSHS